MNGEVIRLARDHTRTRNNGGVFEYQLAGLATARLRALRRQSPDLQLRFQVATNVEGANPFDDVLIHLRWIQDGHERALTYFLQLKHKENTETPISIHDLTSEVIGSRTKDFNLRHYYHKLKDAIENVASKIKKDAENDYTPVTSKSRRKDSKGKLSFTQHVLSEWFQNDYRVILLTTKDVIPKESRGSSSLDFPFEEVFYTGQGEVFSFSEANPEIWNMFAGTPEETDFRSNFLQRLRIFSAQTLVSALEDLLQTALADALGTGSEQGRRLVADYSVCLHKWWDSKEGDCLSESTTEIEGLVKHDLHKQLHLWGCQPSFCQTLSDRLKYCNTMYIVVRSIPLKLRCSALMPALRVEIEPFIIITETAFKEYPVDVLLSVCFKLCKRIVLSVDCMDVNVHSFLQEILPQKEFQVIVVSSEWNESIYDLLLKRKIGNACWSWSENWALANLAEKDQKILLDGRIVFQGLEMTLLALQEVLPSLALYVRGPTLAALQAGEQITLGSPVPDLKGLYLPRTLEYIGPQITTLKSTIWKLRSSRDQFILRGFSRDRLARLRRPGSGWEECRMDNGDLTPNKEERQNQSGITEWISWDDEFDLSEFDLSESDIKKNLHLLTYEGGNIVHRLLRSFTEYRTLFAEHVLEGNLESNKNDIGRLYVIEDVIERYGVTFIASVPGMGKSSFVMQLAQILKKHYSTELVVLIKISQAGLMEETPERVDVENIVELLTRVVHPEISATRQTMRHFIRNCLTKSGRISIIIDGFDEVCPVHKEKALTILRLLIRECRFRRLWVTTRPVQEEDLSRTLRRNPFRLCPFSRRRSVPVFAPELVWQSDGPDYREPQRAH